MPGKPEIARRGTKSSKSSVGLDESKARVLLLNRGVLLRPELIPAGKSSSRGYFCRRIEPSSDYNPAHG